MKVGLTFKLVAWGISGALASGLGWLRLYPAMPSSFLRNPTCVKKSTEGSTFTPSTVTHDN